MAQRGRGPDWKKWLERWDRQQESFNPDRERRFEAMFDVLDAWLPDRFTAIDLGCGPGSLSQRLLRRFPKAHVVAVDFDPVALRLGRESLASLRPRITWVDADIGKEGWTKQLPLRRVDAAVSTTALHWLRPEALRRLYRDLGRLIRRGGVFLNGDILPWGPDRRTLRRLADEVRATRFGGKSLQSEWGPWRAWWSAIEKVPALRTEFDERRARSSEHPPEWPSSLSIHARALRQAGFREVEVVWQDFENRILFAVR
jgi:SAM-dependent methyltransferase